MKQSSLKSLRKIYKGQEDLNNYPELKKDIFELYFPQLDYKEYKNSDIWYSVVYLDCGFIDTVGCEDDGTPVLNDLWGDNDVGPVG